MNDHVPALKKLLTDSIVTDRKSDLVAYRDIGYPGSMVQIIVRPSSYEDISALLGYCNEHRIPVVPWGGGTNLCGALSPGRRHIALDLKSLNKILRFSKKDWQITVQAGTTIHTIEQYLNQYGFRFCHDPWSARSSTVGGALSLDSAGNFYPLYGSIGNQLLSLKIALYDGRILTIGRDLTKSSASPFLPSLFIGAEGRFGIILEATFSLAPLPESSSTIGFAFSSFQDLFIGVENLKNSGLEPQSYIGGTVPSTIERLQPKSERMMVKLLGIHAALFLYYEGLSEEVEIRRKRAIEILQRKGRKMPDTYSAEWWENRHTYFEMSPELAEEGIYVHVLDLCVPQSKIMQLFERVEATAKEHSLEDRLSHTLFGAVDAYTIALYVEDNEIGRNQIKACEKALIPLVHEAGGTITRTHGLGTLFSDDVAAMEIGEDGLYLLAEIRKVLDPNGILNPDIMSRRI